jgi:Helix-turn-helix.
MTITIIKIKPAISHLLALIPAGLERRLATRTDGLGGPDARTGESLSSSLRARPSFEHNLIRISFLRSPDVPDSYNSGDYLSLEEMGRLARRRRKREDETQEEAAASLGVGQANISRAENGQSDARETLFRLIRRYTDLDVESEPRYRLIEKGDR